MCIRDSNIDYCNESIKKVYHELFDEALERYNAKQTRTDRKIANYYEKIRSSKQEKPFHELILQIGDKENMSAESENGQLARQVLDEYYRGFQERNPQLRVFSAHLHLDEATPHLHIDFVPFTTGSKRGLDTRVSLKQALAAQGFKGGSRGDTEWSQWVLSEKERLAAVMERYGIEWEQKDVYKRQLLSYQDEKGKPYSQTYLKTVNNQLDVYKRQELHSCYCLLPLFKTSINAVSLAKIKKARNTSRLKAVFRAFLANLSAVLRAFYLNYYIIFFRICLLSANRYACLLYTSKALYYQAQPASE